MGEQEMPKYKSHKEVWALKIKSIVRDGEGENSVGLSRKSDPKMTQPRELGIAIDTVVKHFETQNIVNNCEGCGIETEDKAEHCEVCECKGNEAYKE
jgi:hypothetical protein